MSSSALQFDSAPLDSMADTLQDVKDRFVKYLNNYNTLQKVFVLCLIWLVLLSIAMTSMCVVAWRRIRRIKRRMREKHAVTPQRDHMQVSPNKPPKNTISLTKSKLSIVESQVNKRKTRPVIPKELTVHQPKQASTASTSDLSTDLKISDAVT